MHTSLSNDEWWTYIWWSADEHSLWWPVLTKQCTHVDHMWAIWTTTHEPPDYGRTCVTYCEGSEATSARVARSVAGGHGYIYQPTDMKQYHETWSMCVHYVHVCIHYVSERCSLIGNAHTTQYNVHNLSRHITLRRIAWYMKHNHSLTLHHRQLLLDGQLQNALWPFSTR